MDDEDNWAKLRVAADVEAPMPDVRPLEYVGGVDISFVKGDDVNACAALVVVQLPELKVNVNNNHGNYVIVRRVW